MHGHREHLWPELLCHLPGETGFYPSLNIDLGHLLVSEGDVLAELLAFASKISLLGGGLRTDRNIFASCHRHGSGEPRYTRDQDVRSGGHADDQAHGRDDTIVGAEDGGSEPPDPRDEMALRMLVQSAHAGLLISGRILPRTAGRYGMDGCMR